MSIFILILYSFYICMIYNLKSRYADVNAKAGSRLKIKIVDKEEMYYNLYEANSSGPVGHTLRVPH